MYFEEHDPAIGAVLESLRAAAIPFTVRAEDLYPVAVYVKTSEFARGRSALQAQPSTARALRDSDLADEILERLRETLAGRPSPRGDPGVFVSVLTGSTEEDLVYDTLRAGGIRMGVSMGLGYSTILVNPAEHARARELLRREPKLHDVLDQNDRERAELESTTK